MAAELSTLISLNLDWKPEKCASVFLDCVSSKQQFNTEVLKNLEFTTPFVEIIYATNVQFSKHLSILFYINISIHFVVSHRKFPYFLFFESICVYFENIVRKLATWYVVIWIQWLVCRAVVEIKAIFNNFLEIWEKVAIDEWEFAHRLTQNTRNKVLVPKPISTTRNLQ